MTVGEKPTSAFSTMPGSDQGLSRCNQGCDARQACHDRRRDWTYMIERELPPEAHGVVWRLRRVVLCLVGGALLLFGLLCAYLFRAHARSGSQQHGLGAVGNGGALRGQGLLAVGDDLLQNGVCAARHVNELLSFSDLRRKTSEHLTFAVQTDSPVALPKFTTGTKLPKLAPKSKSGRFPVSWSV